MKPFVILLLILTSCATSRYFERAPEIDIIRQLYSASDPQLRKELSETYYADSAKIYWNSTTPLSWRERLLGVEESLRYFDAFEFLPDDEIELIENSEGEKWVGWWTVMKITVGEQIRYVPVHISTQFVDLKIVKEAAYWDNQLINELIDQPAR
ncbi:MAG: hypothetical protein AAF551_08530 [Bacteroidota bacterium]